MDLPRSSISFSLTLNHLVLLLEIMTAWGSGEHVTICSSHKTISNSKCFISKGKKGEINVIEGGREQQLVAAWREGKRRDNLKAKNNSIVPHEETQNRTADSKVSSFSFI